MPLLIVVFSVFIGLLFVIPMILIAILTAAHHGLAKLARLTVEASRARRTAQKQALAVRAAEQGTEEHRSVT